MYANGGNGYLRMKGNAKNAVEKCSLFSWIEKTSVTFPESVFRGDISLKFSRSAPHLTTQSDGYQDSRPMGDHQFLYAMLGYIPLYVGKSTGTYI